VGGLRENDQQEELRTAYGGCPRHGEQLRGLREVLDKLDKFGYKIGGIFMNMFLVFVFFLFFLHSKLYMI
jgi:hypothetical protein